jgi:hypothetical protein
VDDNLEDIRRDVENTRFALADKIERLENKIETTATTTLNPAYYVRTRPWPTLGVCAFLGWVVGRSLQSRATSNHSNQPKTSVVGHLIRTFISAAASVAGVAAGDFIRDSLKERKTKHTT